MKIGGEYKVSQIGLRQWQKFAREAHLDADKVRAALVDMAGQLPDLITAAQAKAKKDGLNNAIIGRLAGQLIARAKDCARNFA